MFETNVKKFFLGCRSLDARIQAKIEEQARWRSRAERCTPSYSSGAGGGGASDMSQIETPVIKIIALEGEINEAIDELVDRKHIAQEILRQMADSRYVNILTWRYFNLWSWDKIAIRMGYDRMHIWRLHGIALLEAQPLLDACLAKRKNEIFP